ncbi:MAG TPA: alpha/beta fold hydrolase [Dehalococcoidia bacterium]|nr:alpha/beta fold hydrolase [Dehalococcoidia bacterium]
MDDIELAYEVIGEGEPVVLIHPGLAVDGFVLLIPRLAETGRYRLIHYHRAGYGGSSRPAGPVSLADHASHCRALLRHLGFERAHVVGHSSGGNIALQLALDAPELVHTLALLEPAIVHVPSGPQLGQEVILPARQRFESGDPAGAVDTFLRGVAGPGYRESVGKGLPPGAFARLVEAAGTFFGVELPAVRAWTLTPDDAARITQPALAVVGERTRGRGFRLPGATRPGAQPAAARRGVHPAGGRSSPARREPGRDGRGPSSTSSPATRSGRAAEPGRDPCLPVPGPVG